MTHLEPRERQLVESWVEEKFQAVSVDDLAGQIDEGEWERIDPWLAQEIEDHAKFERYPGTGQYDGSMVVRVIITELPSIEIEDPIVEVWSYSELKEARVNPMANDEVAAVAACRWEVMFMDEETSIEFMGETAWIPRAIPSALAPGVAKFASVAGACGFYVFDVDSHVVLSVDYHVRDPHAERWAGLYNALTGKAVGTLRQRW